MSKIGLPSHSETEYAFIPKTGDVGNPTRVHEKTILSAKNLLPAWPQRSWKLTYVTPVVVVMRNAFQGRML